ncbi:hypothetical protein [Aeromicrobium sp. UC242_57]
MLPKYWYSAARDTSAASAMSCTVVSWNPVRAHSSNVSAMIRSRV